MDPRQLEALAKRLGDNANDAEALNAAYAHGQTDPRGYAIFLEKAGAASVEPSSGAHWYCEAATVWTTSLNDAHRAERALVHAVEMDPLHAGAVQRLTQSYQDKANTKAIATLHQRRAKVLEARLAERPELGASLAEIYVELARVFQEELQQADRAVAAYLKAVEFNPNDAYSIYQAREGLKQAGRMKEALPLFAAEQALISGDAERQAALYADEAAVCRELGDNEGLVRALRGARSVDSSDDPGLKQQLGTAILEQKQAGAEVSEQDAAEAEALFVSLAETYDAEYGHSYSVCALELNPANDRAAQLAMYYGAQIGKSDETAPIIASYLAANPLGAVAEDARSLIASALGAGGDDSLIAALVPADDASDEVKAEAFALIARSLVQQGRGEDAQAYFIKLVQIRPADIEGVDYLAGQYRGSDDRALCDLLLNAAKVDSGDTDQRHAWLAEVAELCEGPLKDVQGAIEARRQLVLMDPSDDDAADHLEATLESASKWQELAELIVRRAEVDPDPRAQVEREVRASEIFAQKLGDQGAAAEALARATKIEPDDEERAFAAVELFVLADKNASAIELLTSLLGEMLGGDARSHYSKRLAELLEKAGQMAEAGGAFAEAASGLDSAELWAEAERCFVACEAWEQAARSVAERKDLAEEQQQKSALSAQQANYLDKLGDSEGALVCLKESLDFDPENAEVSARLQAIYESEERFGELVSLLLSRAENISDIEERTATRKRAAFLQRDQLNDLDGMRQALLELLGDSEDAEALLVLADDAESHGDESGAIDFLQRLQALASQEEGDRLAARLAKLLEESGDESQALVQYERALAADESNVELLSAVAHLKQTLHDAEGAAAAYEKLVHLVEGEQKLASARIWAGLLAELHKNQEAIAAYSLVLSLDEEDLEAVEKARDLAEESQLWTEYVRFQAQLVDVEGDEEEASAMARSLASVYEDELKQPEAAMKALVPFARSGDLACREEYERIGDAQGKQEEVAASLVEWMKDAPAGPQRNSALKSAYLRFLGVGNDARAIEVGLELVRMKRADEELAKSLEEAALRAKHLESLQAAFSVLGRELSGPARAEEMVRQAELLAGAGSSVEDALLHGEQALTSAGPEAVEPLLQRLVAVAGSADAAIGVYERQVSRCKSTHDRLFALCRAAEVAFEKRQAERTRQFLDIALQSAGHGEALAELRELVVEADRGSQRKILRETLCESLSEGGKGARDGGKGRAEYLACAARVAFEDLKQPERAFVWLTEALSVHADEEQLDQLVELGESEKDLKRVADCIGQALEKVHDGPLVRMLLRRRFDLYSGPLADDALASEDLKKLYDLSPSDTEIAEQLEARYEAVSDHRGLVKLYEDQILRGRDVQLRAELARKVALLWQDTLGEAREAADAWRRVLRMKSGDEEAKEGLEKAKLAMRKISASEIAAGEAKARKEVEARQAEEIRAAKQRELELEAKAAELKARHSQPPRLQDEDESSSDEQASETDAAPQEAPLPPGMESENDSSEADGDENSGSASSTDEAQVDDKESEDSAASNESSAVESLNEPTSSAEEAAEASSEDAAEAGAEANEAVESDQTTNEAAEAPVSTDAQRQEAAKEETEATDKTPDSSQKPDAQHSDEPEEQAQSDKGADADEPENDKEESEARKDVSADEEASEPAESDEEFDQSDEEEAAPAPAAASPGSPPPPSAGGSVAPPPPSAGGSVAPPPPSASKAPPPPSSGGSLAPPAPSQAKTGPGLPPPKGKLPPPPQGKLPPPPSAKLPPPPAASGKVPPPPGKVPPPPGGRRPVAPPPAMSARPQIPPPPGKRPPPPPGKK